MGKNKWINSEITHLLDAVDSLIPELIEQWEIFSIRYHNNDKKWIRNGDS